ncbi:MULTISPECIES: DMT family transporter [unclassified Bacillus (in: firmicutes)]|uniref:DMT family transporter n=1 Tax=unclassified Bacillus (in: firmicutes) TaxID=185979 RepID=UPI00227FE191|nr:DMT family transporter [Bacillus sp. S20C3]MCY8204866.1 DMT family transporter [Bacillus sp. N12A5]MCY8288731.1 DMT family transporter [Bacillus sp. N13C7]MCY8637745.1 DMT family transporter [Bacillus sp. S17B2]MCY8720379.1 DMT family transporter [Bacillus sp. S10C12M]MCY9142260.1 DMT family transporter [Bacillus sp. T9C1]
MRYIAYILALLAGSALSFEGAIYGELGKTIGQLETSFYNFLMGSIIMGLLWIFFGKGKLSYAAEAPKWSLLGGVLGVVYLTSIVISVPFVGVGLTMVAVIIGQLIMSMIIEHYGWLGSKKTRINKEKICAVISMIIALILIY